MVRLFRRRDVSPEGEEMPRMSFLEHLEELRRRLIVCLVAVGVGTVASFFFSDRLMEWLLRLAQHVPGLAFQALEVPEKFVASMRLALTAGIALAMPVIVYELWRFLSPGLYPNERRYIRIGLPLVTFFFVAGVAFSYFVALPAALRFLLGYGSTQVRVQPQLQPYLSFVSNLLFWTGVCFEMPVFLFFLSKIGIVDWRRLSRWRKYAFLVICVLAAAITPTPDPVNMMLVALPLYALYECGIVLARFA